MANATLLARGRRRRRRPQDRGRKRSRGCRASELGPRSAEPSLASADWRPHTGLAEQSGASFSPALVLWTFSAAGAQGESRGRQKQPLQRAARCLCHLPTLRCFPACWGGGPTAVALCARGRKDLPSLNPQRTVFRKHRVRCIPGTALWFC